METIIDLDFPALSKFFSPPRSFRQLKAADVEEFFQVELPQLGLLECTLRPSSVFAAGFKARFPSLVQRSGSCANGSVRISLNLDLNHPSSFSASFTIPHRAADWYYVDHIPGTLSQFIIYSKADKRFPPHSFSCQNTDHSHSHDTNYDSTEADSGERRRLTDYSRAAVKVRLAVAVNTDYAVAAGTVLLIAILTSSQLVAFLFFSWGVLFEEITRDSIHALF
jgi:hypothetical protein